MKITGVIAEYNPFHNGHRYHLEQTRAISGADYIIAVISGDFMQRGVPALIHKYARTEMALQNGADLVLELPAVYAAGSAEFFAMGAVSLLDRLGSVDSLCFGSECGSLKPLKTSFPAARMISISHLRTISLASNISRLFSKETARSFLSLFKDKEAAIMKAP